MNPRHIAFYRFVERLSRLKRDRSHNHIYENGAPQKPILLLTICQLFASGAVKNNRILVDKNLKLLYAANWEKYTGMPFSRPDLFLNPFFRLRTDGFWQLFDKKGKRYDGHQLNQTKTLSTIGYISLTEDVYPFFSDARFLTEIYYHLQVLNFPYKEQEQLIITVEEPKPLYVVKEKEPTIWEGFIRHPKFHSRIMGLYQMSCAITGAFCNEAPLVHACHITPHSETGENTVDNGIALCTNLHAAFDFGVIAIGDDYEVLVKKELNENAKSAYALRKLQGIQLRLPKSEAFWPSLERFKAHRRRFGW